MKKLVNLLFIMLLVPTLVLVSCSKDDDDGGDQPQAQAGYPILADYLANNNMDISVVLASGWNITAGDLNAKGTDDYYIMDIRPEDFFNAGRIPGAVLSSLGTILEDAASADKPIVVACHTGQTAGHAVMALRLSGYPDARVLKWGMCSWNSFFSNDFTKYWPTAVDSITDNFPGSWQLPADITPSVDQGAFPGWTTTNTGGAEILAERVNAMLTHGYSANEILNTEVLNNYDNYFLNNYWALIDTEHYGNITGAYRIHPLTIAGDEINYLDPSKPIVTYCWSGQTSSMMTAYLYVLGYDARTLKYGANGMIYDKLTGHKWKNSNCMEYAYDSN